MPEHERRDISITAIAIFFVSLAATGVAVLLLMWGLFGVLRSRRAAEEAPPMQPAVRVPPGPPLEIQDVGALRAEEDRQLESYGWIDRSAGTVRIPVARAMELLVRRGLPARNP